MLAMGEIDRYFCAIDVRFVQCVPYRGAVIHLGSDRVQYMTIAMR